MLYHIVKPIIRLALFYFCKKIYVNTKKYRDVNGPLLLAVNHPNSFFDAVVIGMQFNKPVYFLARGDAFHKPWVYKILTALKCIPVYRLREGKQYLHRNEDSFERCRQIFQKSGIVLIFSEGLCENDWQVRPLKKGTARLAASTWQINDIGAKLKVLPVGVTYNSFRDLPKKLWLNFGEAFEKNDIDLSQSEGSVFAAINKNINTQWQILTVDGVANTTQSRANFTKFANLHVGTFAELNGKARNGAFEMSDSLVAANNMALKWLLALGAIPAILLLFGPYLLVKRLIFKLASRLVHFDSISFACYTLFFLNYLSILFVLTAWMYNIVFGLGFIAILLGSAHFLKLFFAVKKQIL